MLATANGHSTPDAVLLKVKAADRWLDILLQVGGLPAECLDGKPHPCPKCGGEDRFRLIDELAGAVYCNQCFSTKNGDGIAAVQWALGVDFKTALRAIGDYVGVEMRPEPISDDELRRRVCQSKRMPVEAAARYGAHVADRGRQRVLRFPMYGPDLQQCSEFDIADDGGKGLSAKGKSVGLFLPHRDGKPYVPSICFLVEGVKDAAALLATGREAVGLPTSTMNEKFAQLFKGARVVAVPDLDDASFKGFEQTAKRLAGVVESFKTVRLPGEMGSKVDFRDAWAKSQDAVERAIQEAVAAGAASAADDFPRFTLAELHEKFRVLSDPVIHGRVREGETMNFISDPKVGKSWMMYALSICVATGTDWLGIPVARGRVLIVDNELHPETLAHRLPTVGNALGIRFADYRDCIDTWCLRGNLRSLQELLVAFKSLVKAGDYKLIVFDAKYRFASMGVSENDNAAETQVYNLLDQIAMETRAAVVVVHHASKGSQSDKKLTDVGAGAGAQSRAADCHMVLREHEEEGTYVLDAAVRSFPPVKPMALRWKFPIWTPDEWADAGKLRGKLNSQEQKRADRDSEGERTIVDALLKGPSTERNLREKTGLGRERQQRLLDGLVAKSHLISKELLINGRPCKEYHLPEGSGLDDSAHSTDHQTTSRGVCGLP